MRGVNYVPSYAKNPVETWVDWDPSVVERELDLVSSLHFNTVRVFLHLFAWAADREGFLANLESLIKACHRRGIKPMLVLFDDDFYDVANVTTPAEAKAWVATRRYRSLPWMANPGIPMLATEASTNWPTVQAYLSDVVRPDPRLLAYDVMNEPSRAVPFAGGLPRFVAFAINETNKRTRVGQRVVVPATVDQYSGVPSDLEAIEGGLSFHNYYHYGKHRDCTANQSDVYAVQSAAAAGFRRQGEIHDKPVMVSEFGQSDCYCPAATAFRDRGVGWIAWELIASHDQFGAFQGIFYPNGTARSQKEVDCLARLAAPHPSPPARGGGGALY